MNPTPVRRQAVRKSWLKWGVGQAQVHFDAPVPVVASAV